MEILEGKRIGITVTGSHCTVESVMPQFLALKHAGAILTPIVSTRVHTTDTRFGSAQSVRQALSQLCGTEPLCDIVDVEPIGPRRLLDLVIIAPCTGNTLAKLANAIIDSPALMAAKSNLRNDRPVLLAIATNDALSNNAKNLGLLLNAKNFFFVPFGQDNYRVKAHSMQSRFSLIVPAAASALRGEQLQPLLLGAGECLEQ
jgi:dipicolinate synthase subunit B